MRQETIIKTYLTFEELSDKQKQKVVEEFEVDGYLYEHCLEERIDTLKAFAKYINGILDYSISCVPDRGEFITIKRKDHFMIQNITELIELDECCPLTGVCYDDDLIKLLTKYCVQDALNKYLDSIHEEYKRMLTIDYIGELCEANEYEFDADTLKIAQYNNK